MAFSCITFAVLSQPNIRQYGREVICLSIMQTGSRSSNHPGKPCCPQAQGFMDPYICPHAWCRAWMIAALAVLMHSSAVCVEAATLEDYIHPGAASGLQALVIGIWWRGLPAPCQDPDAEVTSRLLQCAVLETSCNAGSRLLPFFGQQGERTHFGQRGGGGGKGGSRGPFGRTPKKIKT